MFNKEVTRQRNMGQEQTITNSEQKPFRYFLKSSSTHKSAVGVLNYMIKQNYDCFCV